MKLALKILFQFRVVVNNSSGTYRKCEERYIVIENVENVYDTINDVYKNKKEWNFQFISTKGHKVYFEFVGIMDYILWEEYLPGEGEFWYDYTVKKRPMENKSRWTMTKAEILKELRNDEKKRNRTPVEKGERLDPHVGRCNFDGYYAQKSSQSVNMSNDFSCVDQTPENQESEEEKTQKQEDRSCL